MAAPRPVSAQLERAVLEVPPGVVDMRAAALLMSGQEGGDLDLVAQHFSGPDVDGGEAAGGGVRNVLAVVEVDGLGVLEATAGTGDHPLEIFVYVVGPSLDVRDAVGFRLAEPAAFEAQLLDAGVRALAPLRLDPGPQELRILARVGGRFGLRKLLIEVPPLPDSVPAAPLALDPSGRWLVMWSQQRPADDPALGLAFDPAVSQPQALPVVAGAEDAAGEPWPSVLRRRGGDVFTGVSSSAVDVVGTLRLPEDLGRHLDAVLDGYYDAVALRAEGDSTGAARLLSQLEAEAMKELGDGGLRLLLGQEIRGYERLRRKLSDVRPLIGLIRLHLDAADEHRRLGRYRLASFSIATAVRLSEWYADEARDADDGGALRGEAASILASLAGAQQIRGPLFDAVALYRQALHHAPDDTVALFGLATLLSKIGEAEEAAEIYGRLVVVAPEHHEARLRWAVMLQRCGDTNDLDEAHRQFGRLASDSAPGWIASLAYQQLIRLALDAGQEARAAELLGPALARWPDHGPLQMAGLRLAELLGDAEVVADRLGQLDPSEPGAPALLPGGRTRFHEAPHPDFQDLRRRLAELEEARRPELARAVGKIRGRRSGGGRKGGAP